MDTDCVCEVFPGKEPRTMGVWESRRFFFFKLSEPELVIC